MAASLFWTGSADLPPSFVERIFQTYVHPSVCLGLELVPASPQTARFQTRVLQWGRRLLGWPRGSPSLAVQGQLGWCDATDIHHMKRAAPTGTPEKEANSMRGANMKQGPSASGVSQIGVASRLQGENKGPAGHQRARPEGLRGPGWAQGRFSFHRATVATMARRRRRQRTPRSTIAHATRAAASAGTAAWPPPSLPLGRKQRSERSRGAQRQRAQAWPSHCSRFPLNPLPPAPPTPYPSLPSAP